MNPFTPSQLPTGPYPGLRPFEPHEWSIFCGRESATIEIIDRLGRDNVVLIHGGSGCGKSSLIRAGVLPAIERDHSLAGRAYKQALFRPSQGPLRGLARTLAQTIGAPQDNDAEAWWIHQLTFSNDIAAAIEERIHEAKLDAFCLVVDQFEEIFQWQRDYGPTEVSFLVDLLSSIGSSTIRRHVFVIVTMRSDYLGRCAQFHELSSLINRCQYFLPNLDDVGLKRAIVEPAEMFDGEVEKELVTSLLYMIGDTQDQLPVLQHLLMRMWDKTEVSEDGGRLLTLDSQKRTQGLSTALSEHADQIYESLVSDCGTQIEQVVDWMFRDLIEVDVGGRGVRRPRRLSQLARTSAGTKEQIVEVISRYANQSANLLVVTNIDSAADDVLVDISHESLMRHWKKMSSIGGWLEKEFEDGLVWRSLAFLARSKRSVLDSATTKDRLTWYGQFSLRPDRAARYLISCEGKTDIESETEWLAVEALMHRSKIALEAEERRNEEVLTAERRRKHFLLAAAIVAALIASGALVRSQVLKNQETMLKKTAAAQNATIIKLEQNDDLKNQVVTDPTIEALITGSTPQDVIGASGGYIWLGSDKMTNVSTGGTNPEDVDHASIAKDGVYTLKQTVVLRKGLPVAGNKSGPAISIIPAQSTVRIETVPESFRSGSGELQYWAKIQPIELAVKPANKVFAHYKMGESVDAKVFEKRINEKKFDVVRIEQLDTAKGQAEVRHCYPADAEDAKRLAEVASKLVHRKVRVRSIDSTAACKRGLTNPGTLEIWIDTIGRQPAEDAP